MRISDWSSDVCSSDLQPRGAPDRWRDRAHAVDARAVRPACHQLPDRPPHAVRGVVTPRSSPSARRSREDVMKPIFLPLGAALLTCGSNPAARSAAVQPATADGVASCDYPTGLK